MSDLKTLAQLAEKQAQAEAAVESAEAALKARKRELASLSETQIPELMDKLGLTEFKTTTGFKLVVDEKIRASITKKNKAAAFSWLRKNGHGKLIKTKVTLLPSEKDLAALRKGLKKLDEDYSEDPSVHASTLSAFARTELEEGRELPESLGVFRQRVSKIVL